VKKFSTDQRKSKKYLHVIQSKEVRGCTNKPGRAPEIKPGCVDTSLWLLPSPKLPAKADAI
jgi:hypothetical protein